MSTPEYASPATRPAQEIDDLKSKSASLEKRMSELMKLVEANSNYRNEIIWLAEEINRIQKQIRDLEPKDGRT